MENNTIEFERYSEYVKAVPQEGKHILAHSNENEVVVYQAYRKQIADYAFKHQHLGGHYYSYNRMSWIKPNFLWMMYRCGWGMKEGQENILGIWIKKDFFETIMKAAAYSSFDTTVYKDQEEWKQDLQEKEVRLQWDPDHDPYGTSLDRRAIQLGLKGDLLKEFGKKQVLRIENMTPFVTEQRHFVEQGSLHELMVPQERVYRPSDSVLGQFLGIS